MDKKELEIVLLDGYGIIRDFPNAIVSIHNHKYLKTPRDEIYISVVDRTLNKKINYIDHEFSIDHIEEAVGKFFFHL